MKVVVWPVISFRGEATLGEGGARSHLRSSSCALSLHFLALCLSLSSRRGEERGEMSRRFLDEKWKKTFLRDLLSSYVFLPSCSFLILKFQEECSRRKRYLLGGNRLHRIFYCSITKIMQKKYRERSKQRLKLKLLHGINNSNS